MSRKGRGTLTNPVSKALGTSNALEKHTCSGYCDFMNWWTQVWSSESTRLDVIPRRVAHPPPACSWLQWSFVQTLGPDLGALMFWAQRLNIQVDKEQAYIGGNLATGAEWKIKKRIHQGLES